MLDSKQLTNLKTSVHNILKKGYKLDIDRYDVTVIIEDRLLSQEEIMLLFECLYGYGFIEQEKAYANLRHISEQQYGEHFCFTER